MGGAARYARAKQAVAALGDVVAAAIVRPGYADPTGDTSSGQRGLTTGDNYTIDRIEAVVTAIHLLQTNITLARQCLSGTQAERRSRRTFSPSTQSSPEPPCWSPVPAAFRRGAST